MKTYALVEGGVVKEMFSERTERPLLHPDLDVRDVTDVQGVAEGWLVVGDAFTAPVVSTEQLRDGLVSAVQAHMDAVVRARGYDGILSLATYAVSSDATFLAEGLAGVQWRDAVWRHCWGVLAEVEARVRSVPTAGELIAELPQIVW